MMEEWDSSSEEGEWNPYFMRPVNEWEVDLCGALSRNNSKTEGVSSGGRHGVLETKRMGISPLSHFLAFCTSRVQSFSPVTSFGTFVCLLKWASCLERLVGQGFDLRSFKKEDTFFC